MNSDLVRQALEKVGNPNILVNLVSRRVRALGEGRSRPLIEETAGLGAADIALLELLNDKIAPEYAEPQEAGAAATPKRRRKKS